MGHCLKRKQQMMVEKEEKEKGRKEDGGKEEGRKRRKRKKRRIGTGFQVVKSVFPPSQKSNTCVVLILHKTEVLADGLHTPVRSPEHPSMLAIAALAMRLSSA